MKSNNSPNRKFKKKNLINVSRTKLLKLVDQETQYYIKNSKISLNNELPKEIEKKYSEFLISVINPSVNSYTKNTEIVLFKQEEEVITQSKDVKQIDILFFTKCINELGKEFIDMRKRNVSHKKLEKLKINPIDTELSFIDTLHNIRPSKRRSDLVFKFPINKSIEDLLLNKDELLAKNIQKHFNKLQCLVESFKMKSITNNNNYKNFKSFNEELFNILEFKGIKYDPEWESNKTNNKLVTDFKHFKLKSLDINTNPFKSNKLPKAETQEVKWKSITNLEVKDKKVNKNPFQKNEIIDKASKFKNLLINDEEYTSETNFNTHGNVSPHRNCRFNKSIDNVSLIDESCSNYLSSPDYNKEYLSKHHSYTDDNRMSNISNCEFDNNLRNSVISVFDVHTPKTLNVNLKTCKSGNTFDFTESKDRSHFSLNSRNKSFKSVSSLISEVSNDFDFNEN